MLSEAGGTLAGRKRPVIALRPLTRPEVVRDGNIWGFPTLSSLPYPMSNTMGDKPPVSTPMYLGKFDLSRMTR